MKNDTSGETKPVSPSNPRRIGIFISYSHRDQEHLERLQVHLKPLERQGTIDRWDDTRIKTGAKWREEIQKAIDRSRVAVLLISADFLASDFIHDNELPPLLAAAEHDGVVILPVILGPCRFTETPILSNFQTVNPPSKPLSKMNRNDRETLWDKVAREIETAFKNAALTGVDSSGHHSPPLREDQANVTPVTPPGSEEILLNPPAAGGPLMEGISSGSNPRMSGAPSHERLPSEDQGASHWERYRLNIQKRLEELLDGVQGTPVLARLASSLGIDHAPSDEISVKKRLVDYLMEVKDKYAIPKLVGLHGELCGERSDREPGKIADCIDLILPLYFSRKSLSEAWRQLEVRKVVFIEGTVATETGAEVVMSHVDGKRPSFLTHEHPIPRGKHLVPFESSAIGDPSQEVQVLAILEDLAIGAGVVPVDKARTESRGKNVAARTERLRQDLRGWLDPLKSLTGRTPYCALAMPTTPADRENLTRVLKKVREVIPPLVFIELFPESETREQEVFFIRCLNTRLESERKRKP